MFQADTTRVLRPDQYTHYIVLISLRIHQAAAVLLYHGYMGLYVYHPYMWDAHNFVLVRVALKRGYTSCILYGMTRHPG